MKKAILFFLYSLLFLSSKDVLAQAKQTLLYEISGNGLKDSSYLFGTYHLVGKDFIDTLSAVTNALKKSKIVVGEIVVESEITIAQKMLPFMLLKETSLDKLLSNSEYGRVDSLLQKSGNMQLSMLNGLKPVAVQVTLIALTAPKSITPQNPGLDFYFQQYGKEKKKEIIGLETIEEQSDILLNTPLERQKRQLLDFVDKIEDNKKQAEEMFVAYKQQRLDVIEQLMKDDKTYTLQEIEELLKKRNLNWIEKLPEIFKRGSAFVAVGAGHLVGDDGLIAMLSKKGFSVKPIKNRPGNLN